MLEISGLLLASLESGVCVGIRCWTPVDLDLDLDLVACKQLADGGHSKQPCPLPRENCSAERLLPDLVPSAGATTVGGRSLKEEVSEAQ